MNYFLIDYENVNVAGFDGVSNLTESDYVIVFYSENADTLTFGLHRRINESKANFQFQKVAVKEKNALDFQLCTYLGFLIRDTKVDENEEKNFYYIVSNDKGYSVLPDYVKKFGAEVKLVSNLSKNVVMPVANTPAHKNTSTASTTPTKPTSTTKPVSELEMTLIKSLKMNDVSEIVQNIKKCKTKTDVNSYLGKKFHDKGGTIYRAVKPYLKSLNIN